MATLTCPKCQHLNPAATGAAGEACPNCGVIYAKALEHARMVRAGTIPAPPAPRPPERLGSDDFLLKLRAQTHYPAFRAVAGLMFAVGLVAAIVALVVGGLALYGGSVPGFLGGLVVAALLFVFAKAAKEAAAMLADLSDATVSMAQRQQP